MLQEQLPESIKIIKHENILEEHLFDDKHIRIDCLGLYISNFKRALSEAYKGRSKRRSSTNYNNENKLNIDQKIQQLNDSLREQIINIFSLR